MPPLNPADVHVDRPVANFLVMTPAQGFVAHRCFPIVPVTHESDKFYKCKPSDRIIKDTTRAPNTESKHVDIEFETADYTAEEFAIHSDIPGRVLRNADDPVSPRETAAFMARETVMLDIERRVAALVQASGNPKTSVTTSWDHATLSGVKAAKDIWDAKEQVRARINRQPNTIVMSATVANKLSIYLLEEKNGAGVEFHSITTFLTAGELPPRIWGMEVLIGGASYSTALRPTDVALTSLTDVWNDNVVVFYKEMVPGIRVMTFGSTFRVRGSERALNGRYPGPRDPDDQWEEYCCTEAHKVVSTDACHMIENVLV